MGVCHSYPVVFILLILTSLRCSWTCHKIPGMVRLPKSSQKLVLISRMDTRICVSISDWVASYVPCDWSHSCEIFHAMLKINIVACILYVLFCSALSDLSVPCIYAVASSKSEKKECYLFVTSLMFMKGTSWCVMRRNM